MTIGVKQNRSAFYFLILVAIAFGGFLRVSFTLKSSFPVNDGGLFLSMTRDLVQNHFVIPAYSTYNNISIPFAYPPGAFYVLGILNQYFNIPLLDLFRFFPLVFSILELFLIYPIARLILTSNLQALLATGAFSVIQPAYTWALMGGGVTRSPALFFSMLAILGTLCFVKHKNKWRDALLSIIAIVLTAYFHIEIAWVTAVVMTFLVVYYERSKKGFIFLGVHLIGGIVLLAPYWIKIIEYHGFTPFQQAFSTGLSEPLASIGILFVPLFTGEEVFHILAVLSLLGVYACIATRQYVPVLWLILIPLIDPRSMHRTAALPIALLIGVCLDTYIINGLKKVIESNEGGERLSHTASSFSRFLRSEFPYILAAGVLMYAFLLSALQQVMDQQTRYLSTDERLAFVWVENNTKSDATFLVMPTNTFWEGDPVSEWFPALTNRQSVLTVQGYEWLPKQYREKIATYKSFAACITSRELCYETWQNQHQLSYDYLLIPKRTDTYSQVMLDSQGLFKRCGRVFQNPGVEIYQCDGGNS